MGDSHLHVRSCPESRSNNGDVFAPLELWSKHQKKRRERLISEAMQDLTKEQKMEAIERMKEDLESNHLEVSAEQWDPLSILDGQWGFKELTREQRQALGQ